MDGNLDAAFASRDYIFWQIPSQFNEGTVGLGIQAIKGLFRVEYIPQNVFQNFTEIRSTTVGALCITSFWSSSKLYNMQIRPLLLEARCHATEGVQGNSVCLCIVLPDRSSTTQISIGSNKKNASNNPSTAQPTIVSPTAGNIDKQPPTLG